MTKKRHKISKIIRLHRELIRSELAFIKAMHAYRKYYMDHPREQAKVHHDI